MVRGINSWRRRNAGVVDWSALQYRRLLELMVRPVVPQVGTALAAGPACVLEYGPTPRAFAKLGTLSLPSAMKMMSDAAKRVRQDRPSALWIALDS